MKAKRSYKNYLLPVALVFITLACEKPSDYSGIVYMNYLEYEINRASNSIFIAVEGELEGEYNPGAKQAYQLTVDSAVTVSELPSPAQDEIDGAYSSLLRASDDFYDQMVPYRSVLQEVIDYSDFLLANIEAGSMEGSVPEMNRNALRDELEKANDLILKSDLLQRELDTALADLSNANLIFNNAVIGRFSFPVVNHSFESPGFFTDNYSEVDGWNVFGIVEDWAPKAVVTDADSASAGDFTAKIGSYTQGINQVLPELIQPGFEYSYKAKAALVFNDVDWNNDKFPVILRSRLIAFNETIGDYNYITILSTAYDTLGIDPAGYIDIEHSFTSGSGELYLGNNLALDFEQRHTWDKENQIWAESYISLDEIEVYRKK